MPARLSVLNLYHDIDCDCSSHMLTDCSDVEDEDPAAVALRRRQIRSVAVSGSSVLKRHLADKWVSSACSFLICSSMLTQ